MQGIPVEAVNLGGAAASDLSILGLFLQADIVVKLVMLILLGCSTLACSTLVRSTVVEGSARRVTPAG